MFGRVNGVIFLITVTLSTVFGVIFALFPFTIVAFFSPRTYRWLADRIIGYWLTFPAAILAFLFGVKFRVTGDIIDRSKPAIIIMNHRTRLDWLFFWNALYKMDPWLLTTEKICLKSALKVLPGVGWAMQANTYLFLNRNIAHDRRVMDVYLDYYKESTIAYQLLLFPEGTDRGQRAAAISDAYAEKHNLPKYDYVLHPRTTGFNYIVNNMRKNNYLATVYDVTVAYPDAIIASEMELIKTGRLPRNVHYDIKKYDIRDVLTEKQRDLPAETEVDASQWLLNLWAEKEKKLKAYYETDYSEQRYLEPSGERNIWPVESSLQGYYIALLVWTLTTAFWMYCTYAFTIARVYAVLVAGFYVVCHYKKGGFDSLIIEWFYGRRFFFEKQN